MLKSNPPLNEFAAALEKLTLPAFAPVSITTSDPNTTFVAPVKLTPVVSIVVILPESVVVPVLDTVKAVSAPAAVPKAVPWPIAPKATSVVLATILISNAPSTAPPLKSTVPLSVFVNVISAVILTSVAEDRSAPSSVVIAPLRVVVPVPTAEISKLFTSTAAKVTSALIPVPAIITKS